MPTLMKSPTDSELKTALGSAYPTWCSIIKTVEAAASPLEQTWKPSKAEFGKICLLQHRGRTLLYLTPDKDRVTVAIVLGERAYGLAKDSSLPEGIKKMLSEARPYAEGRGIRFPISSSSEISVVDQLVKIKLAPR
jgi:hypothetical protein